MPPSATIGGPVRRRARTSATARVYAAVSRPPAGQPGSSTHGGGSVKWRLLLIHAPAHPEVAPALPARGWVIRSPLLGTCEARRGRRRPLLLCGPLDDGRPLKVWLVPADGTTRLPGPG